MDSAAVDRKRRTAVVVLQAGTDRKVPSEGLQEPFHNQLQERHSALLVAAAAAATAAAAVVVGVRSEVRSDSRLAVGRKVEAL